MKFRIARHTSNLNNIIHFYKNVLGFDILGDFEEHEGYNGVFVGKKGLDWHLEFTTSSELPKHNFDPDDLLVFYPKTPEEYTAILARVEKLGVSQIKAKNPYWNRNAVVIQDPDGYNVVISTLEQ